VRPVRFLETRDLLVAQRERERGEGVVELVRLGRPHDRRGDGRFVQHPRERDARHRDAALVRNVRKPLDDRAVEFRAGGQDLLTERVGFRALR
jgi:hypothetical protein